MDKEDIKAYEFEVKDEDLAGIVAQEIDTIDLSSLNMAYSTIGASGSNYTSSTAAGANGTSGNYNYYYTTSPTWSTGNVTIGSGASGLHVTSDAEFDGDIKWKGRSLTKLLESIEDRLAILQNPDPKKLEKFAALKKAYDHYKLMEKLVGEIEDDDSK